MPVASLAPCFVAALLRGYNIAGAVEDNAKSVERRVICGLRACGKMY